ncbi:hypothetical protein F4820DRAFT_416115 [Hypoxylon rubiginosum]|uniref:Uncharacterized protein n=1 Tax=Hypoxylon rubiginosum TaxID=110542 RepID=A0ACB9Z555_9PEZI|nr:hypothetical protein F4820DRAFT_416115 [Hypoxylon rubiginosum]
MYSTRLVHVLMVALSVTSVTGVAWLSPHHGAHEVKRQDTISIGTDIASESAAADPTSSSADDPTSSSTTAVETSTSETPTSTSEEPSSTPTSATTTTDNTSPTSTDATPTSTNGPTTTPPTTTSGGSPTSAPTSTSTGGDGNNETTESAATTVSPVTSTFVTVVTTTDAAGQTFVTSSSSTSVTTPTTVPSQPDSDTGMTPQVKNTIIGVCVGVGGAIILAAAGVLFWRLRSKRRNPDESEELVSYGDGFSGPGAAEKSDTAGSTTGRTPFQSTLESYHAPTQTNAASNF